jgi:hypothetical protein
VILCPDVFELTDAGYAVVLLPDVPSELEAVVREVNRTLWPEATAVTRADLARAERRFWLEVKPIGIMFTSGVLVANLGHNPAWWWKRVLAYLGLDRLPAEGQYFPAMTLTAYNALFLVYVALLSASLFALIDLLAHLDPEQAAGEIRTFDQYLARSIATPRFTAILLGAFAALALLLAGFGLYGVMAYSVAQRRREIGIRMALGAQAADVRSLVVSQAMRLGAAGLAMGIAGALAVTRVLDSLLFGVSASDPLTFATVSAALITVLILAAYLPARRATRVDPIVALRAD